MVDAITTALKGLNVQKQRFAASANNIANVNTETAASPDGGVDLATEFVTITETKIAYKADLAVVKVADEMNRSLLDILA